ncbi:MAG: Gfo/Idh/MocA family oxidoreductase [Planctomycetaceae bacterium]|nr:Gfo/Idh/MocA family oxidoreductase [Planctomycetaceae bacterium]MCB9950692.1 Gfo/Idh/MocA family oxidoreductase [Planctomycetaceae bacterium]
MNRRSFLSQVAVGVGAATCLGRTSFAANSEVRIGCVGVGGKGWSDMHETSVGHKIVAICDIDEERLAKAHEKFPDAQKFTDWRKLLEHPGIDAVTVSTPDHMHAAVTISAMELGKHAYTQKPLAHSVFEARRIAEVAEKQGVITQMGIQHHATARLKLAVHAIQDGAIGKVSDVHVWTDRPGTFWKQGLQRPAGGSEAPKSVHWDNWIGVAPFRPYVAGVYHPFHWRGWWDFGTGALGDMGCHLLDPVVNALQLSAPKSVSAEGPEPDAESGPLWCIVTYKFPGSQYTSDEVKVTWYEASKMPDKSLFLAPDDWKGSQNGVLFRGEKGNLFVGFPEMPELFPKADFANYKWPELSDHNHYTQWTSAIANGTKTNCPFSYSGPLTETVLLGNVAYRTGQPIEWDSKNLVATNCEAANKFIRREYRDGWSIPGLG